MSPPGTQRPAPGVSQERAPSDADREPAPSAKQPDAALAASGPRKVSVAAHERWQASLCGGPAFDPEDDLADLIERPRQMRKGAEVNRVLALLDELQPGGADS